jgi:hypothetical protein
MTPIKPNFSKLFHFLCKNNEWEKARCLFEIVSKQIKTFQIAFLSKFCRKASIRQFELFFCHFPFFNKKQYLQKILFQCCKNNHFDTFQYIYWRFYYSFHFCNKKQWQLQSQTKQHFILSHFTIQNLNNLNHKCSKKIFSLLFKIILRKMKIQKQKERQQTNRIIMQNHLFANIIRNFCHFLISTKNYLRVDWMMEKNKSMVIHWNKCFVNVCEEGFINNAKWIYEKMSQKISKKCLGKALRYGCYNEFLEIVKWIFPLVGTEVLFARNHFLFRNCCKYKNLTVLEWLCCQFPNHYFATIVNGSLQNWFIKLQLSMDDVLCSKNEINYCQICDVNTQTIVADVRTGCGHFFCYNCITLAFTIKKNCPYCRVDLEQNMFAKINYV